MKTIEIYSAKYCSYCQDAKAFFAERNIPFTEFDVTKDLEKRKWLQEVTKQQTVPQIFIDGVSIGGYSDLLSLEEQGRLEKMLAPSLERK